MRAQNLTAGKEWSKVGVGSGLTQQIRTTFAFAEIVC
jgi:hypothetical protein